MTIEIEKIYIPTLGRLANNGEKQHTYKNLSDKYKERTIFVVQESESTEEFLKDKKILIVPNDTSIAQKREIIVRDAKACKFCMFDDDLSFYVKPDINVKTKIRSSDEDLDAMFNLMASYLDEVVFCGLGATYTMYTPGKYLERSFRVCLNVFYNGATLPVDKIDWVGCPHAEDFYVTLQLLNLGYDNIINIQYLVNHASITNAAGGASLSRTLQKHNDSMEFLKRKYPKYTKIIYEEVHDKLCLGQKKAKIHIQWKKLYKDSLYKKEQQAFFN